MSHTPESSAIRITPALEKEISEALPDQIKLIMARAAIEQQLVTPDQYNPSLLHPTELADHAPRKFAKHVTLNGTKYLLEGGSPEELANAETSLYQQVLEQSAEPPAGQHRDAQGRFVSDDTGETPQEKAAREQEAANRAELELAWKRGDITAEQYLEQSGAIGTYLENHGVSPDALVAVTELVTHNTWAACTEAFLNSPEGESWPGGEENKNILAALLEENGMIEPTVENLTAAYRFAQEQGLLVENPETTQFQQIGEATSVADIRAALGRPSTGLFDRR